MENMIDGRHFGTYGREKKTQNHFTIIKSKKAKQKWRKEMCDEIEYLDRKHGAFKLHNKI